MYIYNVGYFNEGEGVETTSDTIFAVSALQALYHTGFGFDMTMTMSLKHGR